MNAPHDSIDAPTFATLKRVALKNPIVAAFVHEWETGHFCTLEQCLMGLSCHLAEQNEQLKKQVFEMALKGRVPTPEHVSESPFGVSDLRYTDEVILSDCPLVTEVTIEPRAPSPAGIQRWIASSWPQFRDVLKRREDIIANVSGDTGARLNDNPLSPLLGFYEAERTATGEKRIFRTKEEANAWLAEDGPHFVNDDPRFVTESSP